MNDQLDNRQSVKTQRPTPATGRRADTVWNAATAAKFPEKRPPLRTARQDNEVDGEDDNLIGRPGTKLTIVAIIAVGALTTWFVLQPKSATARKAPERMVMIQP